MSLNKDIERDTLKQFSEILLAAEDELKNLLKYYDVTRDQLKDILVSVMEKYGTYDELLKYDRLKKFDSQIAESIKQLGKTETKAITGLLGGFVAEAYYRNAFVLEKNLRININFNLIKPEVINRLVNMPTEGLEFSERLYFNQLKLKQNVKAVLVDGLKNGKDLKSISKLLDERMNIGKGNAMRIVRTESSRVWYEGQRESWVNVGVVKQVILIATLDSKTSNICRERSGNIYDLGKEPSLPFHPNERSTYGAYFDDWKPTEIKDNETKDIITYKTYAEWHDNKIKK